MLRPLLLALALAAPAAAQADWTALPGSPFDDYRWEDGSFVTPHHGWVVSGGGEVYETTDAGDTWTLRSVVPQYLRATAFVDASHGWMGVLFNDVKLYETTDGGATLQDVTDRIHPAIDGGVCGLFALSETHVWGAGQYAAPAYLIETTDGGASWASRDMSDLAGSLVDVYFLDSQRGFAVGGTAGTSIGGKAVVLATEDGGATWEQRFVSSRPDDEREWAWKIAFPTPEVGYVSVEDGSPGPGPFSKVLKTTDGGVTWAELSVEGAFSMQGIGFISETEGWVSGRGDAVRTVDGGASWQPAPGLDGQVNRFEFFGDTLGYAMGQVVHRLRRQATSGETAPAADGLALSAGPSPTAGPVSVAYAAPAGDAVVDVVDALGRRVARLASGRHAAGEHRATWAPGTAAPGVYLVRLRAGASEHTVRVVRL